MIRYVCTKEDDNILLSSLLSSRLDIYTSTLRKLKAGGGIFLNGEAVHVRRNLHEGDLVEIDLSRAETPSRIPPEPLDLDIVFEDEGILAVNKPAMSVVHPTCFHRTCTIAAGVVDHYNRSALNSGIHLINRLDLGTSGLLLFAKYGWVQEQLRRQAEAGDYKKTYIGIVDTGSFTAREILVPGYTETIDLPIARDLSSIINRKIDPEGDRAVTIYKVLAADDTKQKALLSFSLLTGRTHQIRVHMSHIGLPLTGDSLYNPEYAGRNDTHQLLHQYRSEFNEPLTGERLTLTCPVPENFSNIFPELFENGYYLSELASTLVSPTT